MSGHNVTEPEPPLVIPPLSVEEEDAIIHTRITNDERPLRRIVKKFHTYASLVHSPRGQPNSGGSVDDAREAFLVELSSFELSLKKSLMICEAESRQVEEYQRERQRIEQEHKSLRAQIAELKTALEHAQMDRRRKMEYDAIAEKINTFPSRDELQRAISVLENDMATIHVEHEMQERIIRGQKSALDTVVTDLASLRLLGKDKDASRFATPVTTPALDLTDADEGEPSLLPKGEEGTELGEVPERREGEEEDGLGELGTSTQALALRHSDSPSSAQRESRSQSIVHAGQVEDDDIEMGEVAEDPKQLKIKKKAREELEEGEASDSSSALSDPPDD